MIGLGFDPGLTAGAALVQWCPPGPPRILWAVRIATSPKDGSHPERYRAILAGVDGCSRMRPWPEVAGVEDQRPVVVGTTKRGQTNADALHGLILQGAFHGWVAGQPRAVPPPVHEIRTEHVKIALCGKGGGRASKEQIRQAVQRLPRADGVKEKLSEHAADAVGIALAAIREERRARLGMR